MEVGARLLLEYLKWLLYCCEGTYIGCYAGCEVNHVGC